MYSKPVFVASALCLVLAGCDSTSEALFGGSVSVSKADNSPPSVRILIADIYVKQPVAGDLKVKSEQRFAQVEPFINIVVSAYDPEGVRFIELGDIVIEPFCGVSPEDDGGNAGSSDRFQAATPVTVSGERIALPSDSVTATTRLTLVKSLHIASDVGEVSSRCPRQRPVLGNAVVHVTARAGNFGGQTAASGPAILSLKRISDTGALALHREGN